MSSSEDGTEAQVSLSVNTNTNKSTPSSQQPPQFGNRAAQSLMDSSSSIAAEDPDMNELTKQVQAYTDRPASPDSRAAAAPTTNNTVTPSFLRTPTSSPRRSLTLGENLAVGRAVNASPHRSPHKSLPASPSSNNNNNNNSSSSWRFSPRRAARKPASISKTTLFANRLAAARRSTTVHKTQQRKDADHHHHYHEHQQHQQRSPLTVMHRRYNTGDYVLVSCGGGGGGTPAAAHNPVNAHGFPPSAGDTLEEQRGPFCYVLCTVQQIHFEEIALYYTVTRCDTHTDQRADVEFMRPVPHQRGEWAALRAAAGSLAVGEGDAVTGGAGARFGAGLSNANSCWDCVQSCCFIVVLPFLWLYDWLCDVSREWLAPKLQDLLEVVRVQAFLVLNGHDPFVCRLRLTFVNLMCVCSIWFMFIDQARLAWFPASSDEAVAGVSLAVWLILVLELLFEVFIRPDGYRDLIVSDKAYAPTTVRFINAFHVTVESISLALFVPEFWCLIQSESCSMRYPFSFQSAIIMAVIGPSRLETFYGQAYLALIRLRVFGLVRHWRNMWITNAFINMKFKMKRGGFFSVFIPSRGARTFKEDKTLLQSGTALDAETREEKLKDLTLTNASNIGTALMVTNSYRALVILWIIMGVFPMILSLSSTVRNPVTKEMTEQLQATNLVASDLSDNETCPFLQDSVSSWVSTMTQTYYEEEEFDDPFLLSLVVKPFRCNLNASVSANVWACGRSKVGEDEDGENLEAACHSWAMMNETDATAEDFATTQGVRRGSITSFWQSNVGNLTTANEDTGSTLTETVEFSVLAMFDQTAMIEIAYV